MKEIGKLIELLGNWDGRNVTYNKQSDGGYMFRLGDLAFREERICSKKFGFIKWLVENDKINLVKVYENLTNYEIEIRIRAVKELLENNEEDTIAYLKLLMLLAIQDEPIRFLCEIIK